VRFEDGEEIADAGLLYVIGADLSVIDFGLGARPVE
jgi:hypothetical protein